jgi:hypothetical protein
MKIADWKRGAGPVVATGYARGDSWRDKSGTHIECEQRVYVVGPGTGVAKDGKDVEGVLVRCGGCLMSWVIGT